MSANITDYFNKASNMSGSYPPVATVTAARSIGGSTLSCDDLSGWATDTPVHFSTFKVNADGTIDTTTQTDWKGIVNGNTVTDLTRLAGAADSGNASGDRVELNPTIGWLDDLITGILVSHKQNGGLKDSVVTENTIATGAVTSSKVAAGAISSYDKIGDDVIQARNIDLTTLSKITVKRTSDIVGASAGTIGMDATVNVIGDKLTLSNSGVKIGANVSKVLVSANVFFNTVSGKAYGWYDLRKNGYSTGTETIASITNGSYGSGVLSPTIISVSKDDVLTLYNKESGSNIRGGGGTYMTVEVIS